jgi:ribonuclease HI
MLICGNVSGCLQKHKVDFKWIKGHNNHVQNESDELALCWHPCKTTFCRFL